MSTFNYVARDAEGKVVRSMVEAPSRHEALQKLRDAQLTVVDLFSAEDPAPGTAARPGRPAKASARRRSTPGRLSRTEQAVFCRQLAIAVNAGVSIREALESINQDVANPRLNRMLDDVIGRLHEGEPLSQALSGHRAQLGPLFIALIRAAEEAGSMPQTLNQLSVYLERSERLARKIRSITAYPLFVAGFFLVVCVIMTVFILPQFQDIFGDFESELPTLTRVVFGVNTFLLDHSLLILLGAVLVAVAFALWRRTPSGRIALDQLKLRLPFFGDCIRKYAVARFSRNLSIMLQGGVPVTAALEITASVSGNKIIENALLHARDRILNGMDISSSLGMDPEIPRLVIRMISIGENSGQLPQVLEKVAESYEDQVEGSIMVATSLFEPLIICIFGALVLLLVMAIYMPVFTVASGTK